MTTFHYSVPESAPSSPWEGLSDQARTSLASLAVGPSPANQLLTPNGSSPESLDPEVLAWAETELGDASTGAIGKWQKYGEDLSSSIPTSFEELLQISPNIIYNLPKLFEAKKAITASNEMTPEDLNVGEAMHLVLIPWAAISDIRSQGQLKVWIDQLRTVQNIPNADYINEDLLKAVAENAPLYRADNMPSQLLTSTTYLEGRVENNGPWGVMLVQTSDNAGLKRIVEGPEEDRSPDAMTDSGISNLLVAGFPVDKLGFYEWISLTLQEDPSKLSSSDYSWLLANRLTDSSGDPCVPAGDWSGSRVRSPLYGSDYQGDDARARLAVSD